MFLFTFFLGGLKFYYGKLFCWETRFSGCGLGSMLDLYFSMAVHIIGSSEIVFVLLLGEWNVYLFCWFYLSWWLRLSFCLNN